MKNIIFKAGIVVLVIIGFSTISIVQAGVFHNIGNSSVECVAGEACELYCQADSCREGTITAAANQTLYVRCAGSDGCYHLTINGAPLAELTLDNRIFDGANGVTVNGRLLKTLKVTGMSMFNGNYVLPKTTDLTSFDQFKGASNVTPYFGGEVFSLVANSFNWQAVFQCSDITDSAASIEDCYSKYTVSAFPTSCLDSHAYPYNPLKSCYDAVLENSQAQGRLINSLFADINSLESEITSLTSETDQFIHGLYDFANVQANSPSLESILISFENAGNSFKKKLGKILP